MTPAELAAIFARPAEAGQRALEVRAARFGRRAFVRAAPEHPPPAVALVLRDGAPSDLSPKTCTSAPVASDSHDVPTDARAGDGDPGWPDPASLRPGDRLVLRVDPERGGAYFDYLARLAAAAPAELSVAPFCARAGGLFRLHLICAARLVLPRAHVEARHDLLGIRLAQVALSFGADTLAGPLARARHLPLAGVTRPDEATPAGLATLIEQAGLEPVLVDLPQEVLP